MENASSNNWMKSKPLSKDIRLVVAFYDPEHKTYFRGYDRKGMALFGEYPIIYPAEQVAGAVKRHSVHLLHCEVHYFEMTILPVDIKGLQIQTVERGGDTNDRATTPSNVHSLEQPNPSTPAGDHSG